MFFPRLRKGLRILLAALDAGKHVYCEWPLGRNLQEAEELAAAQNTPESMWPAAVAGTTGVSNMLRRVPLKWSQFLRNALFWAWKQPFLKSEQPRW